MSLYSTSAAVHRPHIQGVQWLWTVAERQFKKNDILVSIDKTLDSGLKYFALCDSFQSLMTLIRDTNFPYGKHFYEVIIHLDNNPVFFAMDVERELYEDIHGDLFPNFLDFAEQTIHALLDKLAVFLQKAYRMDFVPEIGVNTHVAQAHVMPDPLNSDIIPKISFHIKFNILMPSWAAVGTLINKFIMHVLGNKDITPLDEQLKFFFFRKRNHKNNPDTCIIDTSVYSNKRSWRCLYATKFKENAVPLTPFKNSSDKIEHHFVNYYPEACTDMLITNFDDQIIPDFAPFPIIDSNNEQHIENNISPSVAAMISDIRFNVPLLHSPGEQEQVPCTLSKGILDTVTKVIQNSKQVEDLMGGFNPTVAKIKDSLRQSQALFVLKKSRKCKCPVANRVHKSNNCEFHYDHTRQLLSYKCRNEQCNEALKARRISISLRFEDPEVTFLRNVFASQDVNSSINGMYNFITPDESYSEPVMRPLPDEQHTIVVEAPCGAGKTNVIIQKIKTMNDNATILILSHSRNLCYSLFEALRDYDFVLYNDKNNTKGFFLWSHPRLICCVNSMHRIAPDMVYDLLVIDEHMSVAASTSQPAAMMKHSWVIPKLIAHCKDSKQVILMDANASSYSAYSFASYVATLRGLERPYWIRNTYRRPTNRTFHFVVSRSNSKAAANAIRAQCLQAILKKVRMGKRIVVPTSSSEFANFVYEQVSSAFPHLKTVVYTGETEEEVRVADIQNVDSAWADIDVLIYSPAINAGVSFTKPRFHEVIAFFINSPSHPPVDVVFQMCFRVRCLVDGVTTIFASDPQKDYHLPLDPWGIDRFLDNELRMSNGAMGFQNNSLWDAACEMPDGSHYVQFKKEHLSYFMLRGFTHSTHLSRMHFSDALVNTINREFNVQCTVQEVSQEDVDATDKAVINNILSKNKELDAIISSFSWSPELNNIGAQRCFVDEIRKKQQKDLTLDERRMVVVYEIVAILGLRRVTITQQLFDTIVAHVLCEGGHNYKSHAHTIAAKLCRFMRLKKPRHENTEKYLEKISYIMESDDPNITLAATQIRPWYDILLIVQDLLRALLPSDELQKLLNCKEKVTLDKKTFEERFTTYVQEHDDTYFKDVIKRVGLNRDTFCPKKDEDKTYSEKVKESNRAFAKDVLKKGAGIILQGLPSKKGRNCDLRVLSVDSVQNAIITMRNHVF